MPDELRLPELARSLRSLGAIHGTAGEAAHEAVFGPLLDARARAAGSGLEVARAAFRGHALGARIVARASDAARAGETDPARARARVAEARDAVEPLRAALHSLDALAQIDPADEAAFPSPAQAAWTAQLARVFRAADAACSALAIVLAEPPAGPLRGWFGRLAR